MITLDATSLRSRVARRIFAVFLVCAFIPFAGLVIFSYSQVSEFFNGKTEHQLRALAKTLAVDTFQRLLLSKSSLTIIASTMKTSGRFPTEQTLERLADHPTQRWKALAVMTVDGGIHRLFGDVDAFPHLSALEQEQMSSGKPLIIVNPSTPSNPARVFLSLIDNPRQPDHRVWIGELREAYLWGIGQSQVLPPYIMPCVINRRGTTVMCAYSPSSGFIDALGAHIDRNHVGTFEWREKHMQYRASYWTIPIRADFASGGWTVVLRTSREGIFASIAELKKIFFVSIIVSIGLSILLAIYQFRKRLIPLEQLQEGTRRIAKKDFDVPVRITSGDEFEEIGVAFNTMASQLRQQFNTIETTAEIDRAVLSLLDTPEVIETILTRLMGSLSCDCATLSLLDSNRTRPERFFVVENSTHNGTPVVDDGHVEDDGANAVQGSLLEPLTSQHPGADGANTDLDPVARLVIEAKKLFVTSDLNSYAEICGWGFARQRGLRLCLAAPLFVKGEILGVMSFYANKRQPFRAEEIAVVKGVMNQAAIAIHNSQLFEQTRQQADELDNANKVKDEFLGIISYELRTPLNLILGYRKMIQERTLGEINTDQEQAVKTILKQSNELLETIENIMKATKLEAKVVVTEIRPLNLLTVLDELKPQFTRPPDKDLTISWQFSSSLPLVMTDCSISL